MKVYHNLKSVIKKKYGQDDPARFSHVVYVGLVAGVNQVRTSLPRKSG